ncbi:MAG: RDD family protein [Candidatus Sumerlaeaceae bacterium]|nr:RDD family protein [Candidatus Sumerlaeaceae bacterium]
MVNERQWFFGDRGKPRGPMSEDVLREKFRSGELSPETLVWSPGMLEWVPAKTQPAFADCWQRPQPPALDEVLGTLSPPSQNVETLSLGATDKRGTHESEESWYISRGGTVSGPFSEHAMREMIRAGLIGADTPAKKGEKETRWIPLGKIPQFEALVSAVGLSMPFSASRPPTYGHTPGFAQGSASGLGPASERGWEAPHAVWGSEGNPLATRMQQLRQQTRPEVNYATFFDRFFARLIDTLLIGSVLIPFMPDYPLVAILIDFCYTTFLNSSGWEGTLGKKFVGLRVSDLKGNRISFGRAVLRYLVEWGILLGVITLGIVLYHVTTEWNRISTMVHLRFLTEVSTAEFVAAIVSLRLGVLQPPLLVVPLVNYLRVVWMPRRQTFYDQWVGTIVTWS